MNSIYNICFEKEGLRYSLVIESRHSLIYEVRDEVRSYKWPVCYDLVKKPDQSLFSEAFDMSTKIGLLLEHLESTESKSFDNLNDACVGLAKWEQDYILRYDDSGKVLVSSDLNTTYEGYTLLVK